MILNSLTIIDNISKLNFNEINTNTIQRQLHAIFYIQNSLKV